MGRPRRARAGDRRTGLSQYGQRREARASPLALETTSRRISRRPGGASGPTSSTPRAWTRRLDVPGVRKTPLTRRPLTQRRLAPTSPRAAPTGKHRRPAGRTLGRAALLESRGCRRRRDSVQPDRAVGAAGSAPTATVRHPSWTTRSTATHRASRCERHRPASRSRESPPVPGRWPRAPGVAGASLRRQLGAGRMPTKTPRPPRTTSVHRSRSPTESAGWLPPSRVGASSRRDRTLPVGRHGHEEAAGVVPDRGVRRAPLLDEGYPRPAPPPAPRPRTSRPPPAACGSGRGGTGSAAGRRRVVRRPRRRAPGWVRSGRPAARGRGTVDEDRRQGAVQGRDEGARVASGPPAPRPGRGRDDRLHLGRNGRSGVDSGGGADGEAAAGERGVGVRRPPASSRQGGGEYWSARGSRGSPCACSGATSDGVRRSSSAATTRPAPCRGRVGHHRRTVPPPRRRRSGTARWRA